MRNFRDTRYMRSMATAGAYKGAYKKINRAGGRKNTPFLIVFSTTLSIIGILLLTILFLSFYPVRKTLDVPVSLAVVPGAGITRSGDPSPALKLRLDAAIDVFQDGNALLIMISGASDEVRIMRNYLTFNGIAAAVIIEDVASDNTYDTVRHCADYMASSGLTNGVVFISQKYHIPRIRLLAKKNHIQGAHFLATRRKEVGFFNYQWSLMRESLALIRALLTGH